MNTGHSVAIDRRPLRAALTLPSLIDLSLCDSARPSATAAPSSLRSSPRSPLGLTQLFGPVADAETERGRRCQI